MRLRGPWIEASGAQAVMELLLANAPQTYFVGGCVRDALLGKPVSDVDIATEMRPDSVMNVAREAGFTAVPTGIDHGTVTVVADGTPYEITTFRKDVETDGRRAVVAYSHDIRDDARRRDFTINAIYADRLGKVVDPLGALGDLKARIIRFVGVPSDRIREDFLRILRYFRFHAWYAGPESGFDSQALAAISDNASGLDTLSAERVGREVLRLLAAPDPSEALQAMAENGVLHHILPGATAETMAPYVRAESGGPDPLARLAALKAPDAAARLRLSRAESRRLETLQMLADSETGLGEIAYRHGRTDALRIAELRSAEAGRGVADEDLAKIAEGADAVFPVKADDLMPEFEGAALGARLRELEDAWIDSGFRSRKEDLLAS